ncbi:CAP domain-containing protein [Streptomyces sp. BHT-5-2]|uniref:CAP domain-containing protein n=1 Tax=Streptomyces sp. cg2 TaxID=3238799 RepID=UPI0021B1297E|nr:CAP domain-containing protein [Streptomyces sp. BHT-5-2]
MRTGLLGASAAVAMGAVAVASGLVPGGGRFVGVGGDGADRVRAGTLPDALPQESFSAPVTGPSDVAGRDGGDVSRGGTGGDGGNAASRGAGRTGPATSPASPTAAPSASRAVASPTRVPGGRPSASPTGGTATATPRPSASPTATPIAGGGTEAAAEAEVVSLVNQARAEAGCAPVAAGDQLTGLAERFSDDMARRGFFGHTDPDGHTPWDRARAHDIADLGGENIARGQADAHSVMDSWMSSPGHRANILNCEYKSLGVGAHFGPGGPWWAQEFGF